MLNINEGDETKMDIQKFWGELYEVVHEKIDINVTHDQLFKQLGRLKALFCHRKHLAVSEMPILDLHGKSVLEIGSGAGAHSAFFASLGADMSSIDITFDRARATYNKLDLIDRNNHIILQADAEVLPFPDDYFDIVYSNGVLHHTPQTEKAVSEVHRVLKSGGRAVVMLYARESFMYWINIFLVKGILMGNIIKSSGWLGNVTEWMSDKTQHVYNPVTKVYSSAGIVKLFQNFKHVEIRKNSFNVEQIPLIGRLFSYLLGKFTGYNKSGILLYGHPWRNETRIELLLGKYIGFGLNILAIK